MCIGERAVSDVVEGVEGMEEEVMALEEVMGSWWYGHGAYVSGYYK